VDKQKIVAALRGHLAAEVETVEAAVAAAVEGATHEDSRPENEYDTRGLEQSYLAGAQSARLEALRSSLASLEGFEPPHLSEDDPLRLGACAVLDDGARARRYFLCDVGGGAKLEVDGARWLVLNPKSPLGQKLLGKRVGDVVEHAVRGEAVEYEIVEVG
jgi:hypothetical protein